MAQVREHCCVRLLGVVGLLGALLFALVSPGPLAAAPPSGTDKPEVTTAVHHDTSPPLRDLPDAKAPSGPPRVIPLRQRPTNPSSSTTKNDPVVQSPAKGAKVGTIAGLNFPGVGACDGGVICVTPPDTNGAVGATQYVQWVNLAFAVFNKSNGALQLGPLSGKTLWSGFGGDCQTNNDGDPIVLYDKAAGRWFLTQFSVSGPGTFQECVAVSTTSDATGTYYRYAFAYASNEFNDYPKVGVWPDGYYITYNIFDGNTNTFLYAKACAFDRTRMLAGLTATQQCFNRTSDYSLLPSDLDGTTAPPAGSPNFLLELDNNNQSLDEFKFHVDWTTPGNSTLTGPVNIPVAPFNRACNGRTCIPQPGTANQLDSLGDRLMYRLAYRNFGDHESLAVNHSVTYGSSASGVRWYEIRSPNGTPMIWQQGTYGPDGNARWMGSIAMDQSGNMALGYSESNGTTLYPSVYYTGRLSSDSLSTMQGENVMKAGTGSELSYSRWGDYSAMTVDPVDDCTFWYTNEYWKASGDFSWSTQIASFKFPGCGNVIPPTPTNLRVTGGTTSSITWSWTNPDPTAFIAVNDGASLFALPTAGTNTYTKSGLASGASAGISIAAFHDINSPSPFTAFAPGLTMPQAPSNPQKTAATLNSITFGWTDRDPNSYIYLTDSVTAVAAGQAATSYTVTGLGSGQPVCRNAVATNAGLAGYGGSPYYAVSGFGCGYTMPATPTNLTATHTPTSVTFTWTNQDVYSYLFYNLNNAPLFAGPLGQNVQTFTASNLTAGTQECLRVVAGNYSGFSGPSTQVCGIAG